MIDLFGQEGTGSREYTIFQDESWCKLSNFFYHGFLFVRNKKGREILDKIIKIKEDNNRRWHDISFKKIKNIAANTEEGKKTLIARQWLSLANKEMQNRNIKFYLFGVNRNNIKNFWEGDFNKKIYLKFFEIGLKASVGWFMKDDKEIEPLKISHLYCEYGNYNDERVRKIKWIKDNDFKEKFSVILPKLENVSILYSNERKSGLDISNLLQFTDIILGSCRCAFIKIPDSKKGRQQCVDDFIDIVGRFNSKKSVYRKGSRYFKNFCISFFPKRSDLTKKEFLEKRWDYFRKTGFYFERPTYRYELNKKATLPLFNS